MQMLRDIYGCVMDEPATGPWFGVRYSKTTFGIFEAFPDIRGRDAHVAGGDRDIFRDNARMNEILAPASLSPDLAEFAPEPTLCRACSPGKHEGRGHFRGR